MGNFMELNGGFASKPCLICRGYQQDKLSGRTESLARPTPLRMAAVAVARHDSYDEAGV